MNKDYHSRPSINDLLGLDFIQRWAREQNIMSHQLQKASRKQHTDINVFLEATSKSLKTIQNP